MLWRFFFTDFEDDSVVFKYEFVRFGFSYFDIVGYWKYKNVDLFWHKLGKVGSCIKDSVTADYIAENEKYWLDSIEIKFLYLQRIKMKPKGSTRTLTVPEMLEKLR